MKAKLIGTMLYALLLVGACFTLPEPVKACGTTCELVACMAPFTWGFVVRPGSNHVFAFDFLPCGPCGHACGAYVQCYEGSCSASAGGVVYLGGENVVVFDVKNRKQGRQLMKYLEAHKSLSQDQLIMDALLKLHVSGVEEWSVEAFHERHAEKLAGLRGSCPVAGK